MHQFICKAKSGLPVPTEPNKQELFNKIMKFYEQSGTFFKIQIEPIEKNINEEQEKLYKAFILKAADHFGNSFGEMENILSNLMPNTPRDRWSTNQLNDFITKSSSYLSEYGFHF